jgi:hypothetical protein
MLRWSFMVLGAALAFSAGAAEAQDVVVQGQVQVQQGYGQPPPGYGYGQPQYGQPQYGQPQYAPTYAPQQQRRLQYVDQQESIKALWIPGIIAFGVGYLGSIVAANSLSWNTDYILSMWIPLAGPWVSLGMRPNDAEIGGAVVGGLLQAAGLTMFILGLALTETVRVAVYAIGDGERAPELSLDLTPQLGGGTAGVTLRHF